MYQILESEDQYLAIKFSRTVDKDEYEDVLERVYKKLQDTESIDVLVDFSDTDRITFGAIWEDLKFDIKNFRVVRNLAIVGNKDWQKVLDPASEPFVTGEAKFFPTSKRQDAKNWVHSDVIM